MLRATVDPRINALSGGDSCVSCCCDSVSVRPGETQPMVINYAPWAVPFARKGLTCDPQFDLQQMQTCAVPTGDNLPPFATEIPLVYVVPVDNVILNDKIKDDDSDPLTFSTVPLYSAKYGKVVLLPDGQFSYLPADVNRIGFDRFYINASDGVNPPVMFEVVVNQGMATFPVPKATPKVSIINPNVDNNMFTLSFGIAVTPNALPCEIYRLTVRQGAMDCDCNCYYHISCYDIAIAKC